MFISIIVIIAIILLYILFVYNSIIQKVNSVKRAKSSIEVYLKQKFDLIPSLVQCVTNYTNYEKETLEKITNLRTEYLNTGNLSNASSLDSEMNKILITLENYPELKASEQFLNLQKNLTKMENQLQAARRTYNTEVERYNNSISIVPNNIIAKFFKFKEENFFEREQE